MPNNLIQVAGSYIGTMSDDMRERRTRSEPVIHITDHQTDVILDTISDFWDDTHLKQLNGVDTFDFITFSDESYAEHLADRNRIVIPGEDGEFLEFIIEEVIQHSDRTKAVYASASYLELKKQKVIEPQTLSGQTTQSAVNFALSGTEWRSGTIEYGGIRTIHIEHHTNPYNLLRRISSEFDLELRFRVEIEHHRITGRYVDLIERVGEWRGREVVFGTDLLGVERKERTDQIVTALIGLGPEREDGTRLEVFVEDLDALQRWGRGGRHLIEVYEPESTDQDMTESRLRELTENELEKRVNAIVEYEVNIADVENVPGLENKQIRFGDTIRIKDEKFSPPLYLEARVHTQERSIKDRSRKKVVLGDYIEYTEEDVRAIWRSLQDAIARKISLADLYEHAELKVHRDTTPPDNTEHLWLDTSTEPNVLKRYDEVKADWVKATPTEADEVGAETPQGAQDKADAAQQAAEEYADQRADDAEQAANNYTVQYAQKKITAGTEPPPSPEVGDFWLDENYTPGRLKKWDGAGWVKVNPTDFSELDGQVTETQIADDSIATPHLKSNIITTEHIATAGLSAAVITTDYMSFNRLRGGSATLGGSGDYGELEVLAADDSVIFRADKEGLVDSEGRQLVGSDGVLSQLTFVSSGELNGWQKVGWWPAGGAYEELRAYLHGYIPPRFEIVSATLYTYSRPLRFRGWSNIPDEYYHCPYLHLVTYGDYRDAYLDYPWASEYGMVYRSNTEQYITSATWGMGSWHPEGSKDQVIAGDVVSRLRPGYPFVFEVRTTASFNLNNPMDETKKSLILMELSVTGFKK